MEKDNLKTKDLKKEIIKIFKKFGLNSDHASISAEALINAELVGAYGHGLSRLKMYCDRIKRKVINPKPKIKTRNNTKKTVTIPLIRILNKTDILEIFSIKKIFSWLVLVSKNMN